MGNELVAAWTIEWGWLVALSLLGGGLALGIHLKLSRLLHRNLELEPDSVGSIIARTSPPYLALLVLIVTLDIMAESVLHMPRTWYIPTSLVFFVLSILLVLRMVVRIKKEIFRIRYEPVRRRRRSRKAREDLSDG